MDYKGPLGSRAEMPKANCPDKKQGDIGRALSQLAMSVRLTTDRFDTLRGSLSPVMNMSDCNKMQESCMAVDPSVSDISRAIRAQSDYIDALRVQVDDVISKLEV